MLACGNQISCTYYNCRGFLHSNLIFCSDCLPLEHGPLTELRAVTTAAQMALHSYVRELQGILKPSCPPHNWPCYSPSALPLYKTFSSFVEESKNPPPSPDRTFRLPTSLAPAGRGCLTSGTTALGRGLCGSKLFFSSNSSVSWVSTRKFKIYTKTGDTGQSSLYDGQRRRKSDPTFEALGDVDELNSALGLAHEYCLQAGLLSTVSEIEEIQSRLLDAGSAIATPLNSLSSKKVARVKFNSGTVEVLEKWIDTMDEELPQLTSFILPSGGLPAASLHMARSVCRRAERKVFALVEEEVVDRSVAQYLNRLSDYLFTAARYTASKLQKPETLWSINQR